MFFLTPRYVKQGNQFVKDARTAPTLEALESIQRQADEVLATTVEQVEQNSIDESGLAAMSLMLEQARLAIAERRAILMGGLANGAPTAPADPRATADVT